MCNYIIGKTYLLFRDGEFVAEAIWSDDKHNGLCFLQPMISDSGEYINGVFWEDVVEAVLKKDQ